MKVRTIQFATKDASGFAVAHPLAEELKQRGHLVFVEAEGASVNRWLEAGWQDACAFGSWKESDVQSLIHRRQPDAVITTIGSSPKLEKTVAAAAVRAKRPLVYIEDVWGVTSRTDVIPTAVFTIDAAGATLIRKNPLYADVKIIIAGNPALDALVIPDDLRRCVNELRKERGRLVVFAGTGPSTVDFLGVMLQSLVRSKERFTIIPRFHPNHIKDELNRVTWEAMLNLFSAARPSSVQFLDQVESTYALAALADLTVSCASNVLLHAAKHRRACVSVTTEYTRKELLKLAPYDRFPGISSGIALELTEPEVDLFEVVDRHREAQRELQDEYFAKPAMTPAEMADAVLGFCP